MDSKDIRDTSEILSGELSELINARRRLLAELSENAKQIDETLLAMELTEGLEDEPCPSNESA